MNAQPNAMPIPSPWDKREIEESGGLQSANDNATFLISANDNSTKLDSAN
jgi:hypothetical protein